MGKVKVLAVFVLLMLVASSALVMGQGPTDGVPTEEEIGLVLLDYSTSLSTGQVPNEAYYSPAMRDLVQERRSFYAEFFEAGLHSDLLGIESEFTVESVVQDNEPAKFYNVRATEMVTLRGEYRCSSPEEYPLVKSGRWALARTDDPAVRKAIESYVQNMVDGVNQSIQEDGFESVFIVRHDLVVSSDGKSLKIVQDSFSDAANDNVEGHDNVDWTQNGFVRRRSELTKMPDYVMCHTSIEELGQSLLATYSGIYSTKGLPSSSVQYTYNRTSAVFYIRTWVKNTSLTCSTDPEPVYQNKSNWNPAYHKKNCRDCANYVSQALLQGGLPTTGTWYPHKNCSAWNNVGALKTFMLGELRGILIPNYLDLQFGDLAFQGEGHVVMVSLVAPHRYSAHTSDRKDAVWYGGLNEFMIICPDEGCPTR